MKPHLSCKSFFTVLVPMMALCLAVETVNSATTTVTYQVSASANDGYALIANKEIQDTKGSSLISLLQAEEGYSTFFTEGATSHDYDGWAWDQGQQTLDGNSLYIGTNNRDYFVPYPISAMKFSMLGIFRGMDVISANFRIYTGDEMNDGRVYGVIHGGLPGWPYVFEDISLIEKTQASADWDHIGAWEPNTWYYSTGLTNIVQELINRPDWKAGHPMTMVYSTRQKSPGMRSFLSSERGYALAPKLRIRFRACVIFGYVRTAEGGPIKFATIDGGEYFEKRTTDSDGSYQFFVPPGWSGTLTVSKDDIVFKPAQYTYTNLNTHMYEQNFIEYKPKISGFVLDKYGNGLEQANVSANNGGASGLTDANGFYEILVPLNWSGTVTAYKSGWKITPDGVSYNNLVIDQNDQNYSAYQPTISGHAKDKEGILLPGVKIDVQGIEELFTDANGCYQIDVPYMWSGQITASMTGWGFVPSYRNYYNLTIDRTNQDFTSFQPNISGYVLKADGSGLEGATVTSNNGGGSSFTNLSGYYEITVPYNWSGIVSVNKVGYEFVPPNRTYSNVTGNRYNQNYTEFQPVISGYVKHGSGTGIKGVAVSSDNSGGSDTTDLNGYYEIIVPYQWSGVVTPNKVGCTFDPVNRSYTDVTADLSNQDYLAIGGTIYVSQDGSGDFTTIQAAIDAAIDGVIVEVTSGIYTGTGNRDIDFQGKAIAVRGATGDANDCVIDCQGTEAEPHRGFKFVSGEDANSVLEGFTITNGYGPKEDPDENGYEQSVGGAVYSDRSSPTIQNCKFVNNSVTASGGGIYNYLSYSTIINCLFTGNSAGYGGGIFNYEGRTIISNCDFENNSVNSGAGIYNHVCSPEITKCIFTNNNADYYGGGGITNYFCSPKVRNCVFANNSAKYGGGIHNTSMNTPKVTNCIFINNITISGGGIYNGSYYCRSDVKNCIIWNNAPNQISGSSTVTYSNIQGGWTGQGNINTDPCLIDDYHIYTNSPCIDAGDPNYIAEANETDIDDDPRVVVRIDIGPDELFSRNSALIFLPTNLVYFLQLGLNDTVSPQIIKLKNYGAIDLNWRISNDCDWLKITPSIGTTPSLQTDELIVSIDPNNTDYGLQSCQFQIIDPNAENSPQEVTVNLEVLGPELTVSPAQFYFETALYEPNDFNQVLSIQNTGYDTLRWQIAIPPDCNWLSVEPVSGQATGEVNEVTLSVDANGMDIGFNTCELTISAPNAENSPLTVQVSLHVYIEGERHVPAEYQTIQAAIDAAFHGDEVIIEPGIYTGPGNYNIYFRGKAITVRSVAPHNPAVVAATIIEPDTYASGFSFVYKEQADSVVDGLTIRRCIGWAAIDCYHSSPTIRNCIIEDNYGYDSRYYGGAGIACYESSPVISNCVIRNNYGGGLRCSNSDPTVRNCIFTGNYGLYDGYMNMSFGGGILSQGGDISVINCTFSGNVADVGGGICSFGSYATMNNMTISNCIFRDNDANDGPQIALTHYYNNEIPPTVSVSYSDVQGGEAAVFVDPCCTLNWGNGNLDIDPCFAEPGYWILAPSPPPPPPPVPSDDIWVDGDYHLKSQKGRWKPSIYIGLDPTRDDFINLFDFAAFANSWRKQGGSIPADLDHTGIVDSFDLKLLLDNYLNSYPPGQWVLDNVTSPCIDAGDPNLDWTAELWPHGRRINIGAYGGTPEASMSLSDTGNIAELNGDDSIGYADIILFIGKWLYEEVLLAEDLDRSGFVNFTDFAIFANNWEGTPGQASNPNPVDGATGVDPNADSSWTAGYGATSHDVYFGSSSLSFICNQVATIFDPGTMTDGTTYYWRINEVNTGGKTTGQVWTFGPPPPPPLP